MPKSAIAIRHLVFEDLGMFAPVLRDQGYDIRYMEAGTDDLGAEAICDCDLLVVLGGPIGADQDDIYPFLRDELRLVEERLTRERKTLGICLGAQLMARALGARVYPGPAKEIGYGELTPSQQGATSCLAPLAAVDWSVLHWHGDTFDLPSGAVHLASTELVENQAFSLGDHALGLQFHMEADPANLENWLIGHCVELLAARIDIPALRRRGAEIGKDVAEAGQKALKLWLGGN